jgi:hypothetical protein
VVANVATTEGIEMSKLASIWKRRVIKRSQSFVNVTIELIPNALKSDQLEMKIIYIPMVPMAYVPKKNVVFFNVTEEVIVLP